MVVFINLYEAKSRQYRGVFKVKSRIEIRQVRGIWYQQLEHKQVPKGGRNQVSGRVSVPCWHATPVTSKNRSTEGCSKLKSPETRQVQEILVSTLEHLQVPKWDRKCSMETTHNSVKVKLGIKVMKLVESLVGWEITVGQGSECHLTFVRGKLHMILLNNIPIELPE